jgi:VWFA-related protein
MKGSWLMIALTGFSAMAGAQLPTQQKGDVVQPTMRIDYHLVVTDVVVTDRTGNPVHGLSASAFRIFDNGRPERLKSFEECSGLAMLRSDPALPKGTHTNTLLVNAPRVLNAIVIDTTSMPVVDQMSLASHLNHLVDGITPGIPLAIFLRSYEFTVLLQDFTADHQLLHVAIQKAVPHLQKPGSDELSELVGLGQVEAYLRQLPGRKNLLWFNGGTNLFNHPGPWSNTDGPVRSADQDTRATFDSLESGRIAVYPIDVRNLTAQGHASSAQEQLYAVNFAKATGGDAFYNEDDISVAAERAMTLGDNYYTLSYTPDDLKQDGSWHTIHVRVDGDKYTLSYRLGYYDDPSSLRRDQASKNSIVRAGAQSIQAPDARTQPLLFRTQISAARSSSLKGQIGYRVHYDVPAVELKQVVQGDEGTATVGAAIVAFDQTGRQIADVSQTVELTFREALYDGSPMGALSFDQVISLPRKKSAYLYIAIWDTKNGRMGTMNVQVDPKLVTESQ